MSKYTEAIERLKAEEQLTCASCIHPQEVGYCEKYCRVREVYALADEALRIADSLEHAEEICIKACRREGCLESECPHRARGKFCSDLADVFYEGYNQALADIRGDNND